MKRAGKFAVCLAGGLVLNSSLRADEAVLPGNPYAPIVTRNVFGLNPPPLVDPNAQPAVPPPKITPNGITDILGQLQVLFTVGNVARPGKPAGDESYILSEGERQDDIEVLKIDEKGGIVTFNNHGVVQELSLADVSATSASAPATGGMNPNPATGIVPYSYNGANQLNRFSNGGANSGGSNPSDNSNNGANNGSISETVSSPVSSYGQHEQISPEEQIIMMELYREQHKNDPTYPTLPPTELTPTDE